MLFPYLILSHLLGDFVFQTSKMVQWKMKSKLGTATHTFVHFLVFNIVLYPFFSNQLFLLLGISSFVSLTHYLIDERKISYDLNHDKKVLPFLIDQFLHLSVLILIFLVLKDWVLFKTSSYAYEIYTNFVIVIYVILEIFVTKVWDIYRFQKQREKNSKATLIRSRKELSKRLLTLSLLYFIFLSGIYLFKYLY